MLRWLRSVFGRERDDSPRFELRPGQLFSVRADDGGFAVVKLLATDRRGVHARMYVQRFAARPTAAQLGELTLAPFGPGHDHPFSIGHMPLSHATFAGYEPVHIGEHPVADDELQGYLMWEDAEGGYF